MVELVPDKPENIRCTKAGKDCKGRIFYLPLLYYPGTFIECFRRGSR